MAPWTLGKFSADEMQTALKPPRERRLGQSAAGEDIRENRCTIDPGYQLFSAERMEDRRARCYVVTEADRLAATVLLHGVE